MGYTVLTAVYPAKSQTFYYRKQVDKNTVTLILAMELVKISYLKDP